MSNDLHYQIYQEMNLIETNELLEIWQNNDHFEWSDIAFDVIDEILKERGVEIPNQNEPIYDHNDEEAEEDYEFSEEELKIIDDKNPPAFYDPFEVLKVSKWLDLAVKAMIALIVIQSLLNVSTYWRIAQSYFINNPYSFWVYLITALIVAANIALDVLLTYVPLKALSRILRILMEMEFRSRKAN
jgi:hypothetical protein